MRIVRWFFGLLVLAALAFGAAYYYAGTIDGPAITINQPSVIGQGGTLDVSVDSPGAELTASIFSSNRKGEPFPVLDIASASADAWSRTAIASASHGRSARRRCPNWKADPRR